MQFSWKFVNPKDRYVVLYKEKLSEMDHKSIQYLYQPLVGGLAVSLYMTLLNEVNTGNMYSRQTTHRWLMDVLGLPLDEIFQYRKRLEGIGLLKTYKKATPEGNVFIYEILCPLSPDKFFHDDLLPIYLKQKLEERHYERLITMFADKRIPDDYEEITQSFNEVFASEFRNPKEIISSETDQNMQFFSKDPQGYSHNLMEQFDFELLFATAKNSFISRKAFTPNVMESIAMLSYLYKINVMDMSKLILRCQNQHNEIDIDELRKCAREFFHINHGEEMPTLIEQKQPEYERTIIEPKTPEEHLLYTFETTSPLEFLVSLSQGAMPSDNDLALVEKVMVNQKLPPGVVNVLLHYVMLKSDMKLQSNYVETIASHWARKNITTVREAYEMALSEHKKYQTWANEKKTKTNKSTRRTSGNARKEIVPDWLDETKKKEPVAQSTEIAERVRKLKEKLQNENSK